MSANINTVIISGNLTRDPEIKYIPSGTALAMLGIASSRSYKKDEQWMESTTFVDVKIWGKAAEAICGKLKKGHPVLIQGRLETESWDDKQTGQKRTKMVVVADGAFPLMPKEAKAASAPVKKATAATTQKPALDPDLDEVPEDDLPF